MDESAIQSPTTLNGMAWDHPRATAPLRAVSAEWSRTSGVTCNWQARPLKDFEDQPLEELAGRYDLVLIDHPFTSTAAESGLITPVDDWTDADWLEDQREHSVGASYRSYSWAGRQWALAIDAACQVSAVRPDLCEAAGMDGTPGDWQAVGALAGRLADGSSRVAMPLNPNHAYCALLSISAAIAGPAYWPVGEFLEREAALEALMFLGRLASDLHPASADCDPIGISDRMARTDEIFYVPLMFGYSSYARPGFRPNPLRFHNAPAGPSGLRGSVLGGVGVALSARSRHGRDAADLARMLADPDIQSGLYVDSGGQPGHIAAWRAPAANAQTGQFFMATLATMEQAIVRPRTAGHRPFQPLAGAAVHDFLWAGTPDRQRAVACLDRIRQLYDLHLAGWSDEP